MATHLDCILGVGYPKKSSGRAVGNSAIASKTKGKQEQGKGVSSVPFGVLDSGFKPMICLRTCQSHQVEEERQRVLQAAGCATGHCHLT